MSINSNYSYNKSLKVFIGDIKVSHSIFALPFALSAIWLASIPMPSLLQWLLLLVCMVSARSYAMGMNRIVDIHIDSQNPRTKIRALPAKRIKYFDYVMLTVLCGVILIVAASAMNVKAGLLSIPLLFILGVYGFFKRFTFLAHFYLGACLAIAPIAVLIALDQSVPLSIFILFFAICFWTAGFDILYALEDYDFDKTNNLFSVPSVFGIEKSIIISRICFLIVVALLCYIGFLEDKGIWYFFGVACLAIIFTIMHFLLKDIDSKGKSINSGIVFFNINALVGLLYLVFLMLDIYT